MADIEVSELSQPTSFGTQPNVFDVIEEDAIQLERDRNIDATNGVAQTNMWFKNAGENSLASDFGQYLGEKIFTDFTSDPNYQMDDEVALHAMSVNKIPMQYFGEVRGTKSNEELNFRILTIQKDLEFKNEVDNQLTYDGAWSQNSTSALAGQLLDDVAVGVLAGGVASIAARLTGATRSAGMAIMADVGLETGLAAARYATDPNYEANDVFTDLTLGLIPSAIVSYRSSQAFKSSRNSSSQLNGQAQDIADNAKKGETPTTKKDDGETTTPTQPKQETDPVLEEVAHFQSKSTKSLVTKLRKMGGKSTLGIVKVYDELNSLVRKYKNAKTPKARARLAEQIRLAEASPAIRMVRQASSMISDPTFVKQLGNDIKDIASQIDKKSSKAIIDTLKKQISKEDFDTFKKMLDGGEVTEEAVTGLSKGKLTSALGVAMVLPVLAEASGGEGEAGFADMILYGAAIVALGAAGLSFVKASGGVKDSLARLKNTWKSKEDAVVFESSPEAGAMRRAAVKISNSIDTELTNTKNVVLGNQPAMDLVDEMVGKGETIDMNIRQMYEGAIADINRSMRNNFEAWKSAKRDGTLDDFNKLASDYIDDIDNVKNPDPIVLAMVEDYHKIMERMYDNARASEAKGFTDFKYDRGIMPRLWQSEQMKNLLQGLAKDSDDYKAVVGNLENAFTLSVRDFRAKKAKEGKEAFKGKSDAVVAKQYTDKFVKLWTSPHFSAFTRKGANQDVQKIKEYLVKNNIVDADDTDLLDDLVESIVPNSQVSARAKKRVVFNPNYLQDINIKFNGEPMTVNKSTFVERDLMQIADVTSKELAITTAYAQKGYKTRSMLEDKIIKVTQGRPDKEFETLMEYKRLLEGSPTLTNSPFVESFIALSRVAVSLLKLPLVMFSTVPEWINVISRGGIGTGVSATIKSILKAYPPDGEVMQLRDITGLASFNDRLYRKGYIGHDVMNDKLNPNKSMIKFAKTAEDWAYTINRLGWLTDVTQMAGIEANMKVLRKFATTGKGLPISRLEEYGIGKKWLDEFSPELQSSQLDMSGWTTAKKNRFGIVIKSLNQTISPETMLHTKGLWGSSTSFGRAVSPLLNYSATVFNEQGLPLLRHTDRHSIMNNVNAIVGTMIGLNLKYAATGKEVEQEDVLLYAITGSPLAGGFGVGKGLLSPATLGTTADLYNLAAPDTLDIR